MTPYAALRACRGPCALLESTTAAGPLSRLSLLARHPRAVLVARKARVVAATPDAERLVGADPIAAVRSLLAELPRGRWPEQGGVLGALAYDFARPERDPAETPLLVAMAVDRFEVFLDGALVAGAGPGLVWPPDPGGASAEAAALEPERLERAALPAYSSLTREQHRRLVLRAQEHIARGDIYQANLSQRFRLPWRRGGLALYEQLRRLSPAPFSGYLRAGGVEIVSASPERLLQVEAGQASTRPIAGTRPRSADAARDRELARELVLSEKERAEHLMLLDLARNDLGRVASLGSVEVDEMMTVEEYAQVRHIVSNVRARLTPGRDALDALDALFPGGTITGVPKRRCMEILDALEPVPRGFYTGSLFYVTPSGRLDASILIRTAVVANGALSFHTGGGIVADSDPDFEYEETLHKAEGLRLAIDAVLSGAAPRPA